MEKRLIDANALVNELKRAKDDLMKSESFLEDEMQKRSNRAQSYTFIKAIVQVKQAPTIDAVPREEYNRLECELATMKAYMRYIAVELPNPCRFCVHNEAGKVCEQECYGKGMEHFAFEWRGLPDTVFGKMEEENDG